MPLYYFDIYDAGRLVIDEFGEEFDNFELARAQAIIILPDMARDELPGGEHHEFACEVRDAARRIIYRAKLTYTGERSRH